MTVKLMCPLGPGSSLAATTLTGTYATQSAVAHPPPPGTWSGAGALRTNPAAATGFWTLRGWGATGAQAEMAADTLYASVAFYIATLPDGSTNAFQICNSANGILVHVAINTAGVPIFQYLDAADSSTTIATGAPLATGRWYTLEIAAIAVSAVGGATAEFRVDGEIVASASGLTIRSGSRTCDRIRVGCLSSRTCDYYWADLVCDDAGYPGTQYVATLTPDSDVTSAWATGTTADFNAVKEMDGITANDGDTSYLGSSTSGNVSTVGLTTISSQFRRISAVMPFGIIRDEGGSSVINLRHISGGTTTNLNTLDPGATYVMNAAILGQDPDGPKTWDFVGLSGFVVGVVNGANVAARATTLGAWASIEAYSGGAVAPIQAVVRAGSLPSLLRSGQSQPSSITLGREESRWIR